jgi:hypothetical protein
MKWYHYNYHHIVVVVVVVTASLQVLRDLSPRGGGEELKNKINKFA